MGGALGGILGLMKILVACEFSRNLLNEGWDLMIAHPPCTYLCNSGVRWLRYGKDKKRWQWMLNAVQFFLTLWNAPISKICIENPIMHGYAKERIQIEQSQVIQPWQFGHGEVKATCLWLKGLPPLQSTKVVTGRQAKVHTASPGLQRRKERSRTYSGIAQAMADQWGSC